MNIQTSNITIYSPDITAEDFSIFISENFSESFEKADIIPAKKEGKSGWNDFVNLIYSNDMQVNLLASGIFQLFMFALGKLKNIIASEPVAKIKFKTGTTVEIPLELSSDELKKEIIQSLTLGEIDSINFDC